MTDRMEPDDRGLPAEDGAGRDMDVLLVTGMSGAGRGTVARLVGCDKVEW